MRPPSIYLSPPDGFANSLPIFPALSRSDPFEELYTFLAIQNVNYLPATFLEHLIDLSLQLALSP